MRKLLLGVVAVAVSCAQSTTTAEPPATRSRTVDALPLDQIDQALGDFAAWHGKWRTGTEAERAELSVNGVTFANQRARAMASLIVVDPTRALKEALTPVDRAELPAEIAATTERWFDGVGQLDVIAGTPDDSNAGLPVATQRFVTVGGETLRAYVTGPRFENTHGRAKVRVHGVTLGGLAALTDRPTRTLFLKEVLDERLPWRGGSPCPVSKKQVSRDSPIVTTGEELHQFCEPAHALGFDQSLAQEEDTAQYADTAASAWSVGPKTVLFIRVDFSDLPGDPLSTASAQSLIDTSVDNFYQAASYGQTTLSAVVPPTLRMPQPSTFYKMNDNYYGLRADALVAAADAGYAYQAQSLEIVAFKALYSGWAGRGSVGGRGNWLNGNFSSYVTSHELGHNYGVWHANYWSASNNSIIGPGTNQEYGNPFDTMGTSQGHFNAWFKRSFDWLPAAETPTVTTSGTYRIQALELPITSGLHAIKIPRADAQLHDYWVEFRNGNPGNRSLFNGVSINWGYPYATGSHLLDMTPGAPGGTQDSALTFGRTFSDTNAKIHITPLSKAGTTPEAVDVVVNLGAFPGNRAPTATLMASTTAPAVNGAVTFTATATDPDGDALAYAWDFDDDTYAPSAPTAMHTFTAARTYFVTCTVSDMKGQTVTRSVLVTAGAPVSATVQGTVTAAGTPVEGARVGDGTRSTYTDSDGKYALTNVPDASVTIAAAKRDYAFTPSFANPVMVSGDQSGLDFTGTHATSFSVTGRAYGPPDAGVSGAIISDGTRSAVAAGNGGFALSGVPNGVYTLTATKPGWVFPPKAIEVFSGNLTAVVMTPGGTSLSGQVFGAPTPASITDGIRTTAAQSNGYYNLSYVANGTYNVVATLPGYTLTPTFTNPITVTGTFMNGLNFNAVAGTSYVVSGTLTTGGVPLPGVSVSDGTRTSVSDSTGRFVLIGVPPGTYTLTPTHASYTFVPLTKMVTVAAADMPGQDFATTVVNPPPTIVTAASATPSPVTTGTTAMLSVLGADNSGEPALSYTWSTSFFQQPTYSANGTNTAKNATVTFPRAGTYPFDVAVVDPGGLSVHSTVSVVVQQSLVALLASPASANVLTSATRQFTVQGNDQFAQYMYDGPYTWSVSGGGAINPTTGLFTAGATPGGPFTVTALGASGRTATAVVSVVSAASPVVTLVRAMPSPVTGTTTQLSVTATDDLGEPALVYTWSQTTGPAPATFSANGTNPAKSVTATFTKAGDYQFLVSVVDADGNTATGVVSVEVQQTETVVQVSPPAATVQPGGSITFTATVEDQFGDSLAQQPPLTWTVSGGGTVDATGSFTADATPGGPFTVTATSGAISGTTTVNVMSGPDTMSPVVTITAPTEGAQEDAPFDVTVTATDDVGVAGVVLTLDSAALPELTAAPFTWHLDPTTLASGTHLLTATARDAAGNMTTSTPVHFHVGNAIDAPPTVVLAGTADGAVVAGPMTVTVTASDDVSVMKVDLLIDGVTVQTAAMATATFTVMLADGDHTLQADAFDTAGQRGESALVHVTVGGDPTTKPVPVGEVRGVCGCGSAEGSLIAAALLVLAVRRRSVTPARVSR